MSRAALCVIAFCSALPAARAADEPEIPAEKRKEVIDATLAKKPKDAAELKKYLDDPLQFAPGLKSYDKGEIGAIRLTLDAKVVEVVDKKQVLLGIPAVGGKRREVLLSGVDTSNLADGKVYDLKGVYYVTGNAKVGGATVMRIVPFKLTTEELGKLRDK